jgi:LuxR family transcriptional regulator, maltose regulon positive regulatory protein
MRSRSGCREPSWPGLRLPPRASRVPSPVAQRSFALSTHLAVGDVPAAVASARRGLAMEPANGSHRSAAAYYLGVASFYLDPLRARPYLLEFIEGCAGERDPRHRYAMALLAETYGVRGDMDQARRYADQALELTCRWGLEEHPPTNQVHVAHGIVALADGDIDLAEEQFERAVMLARRGHDRVEIAHTLLWMARLRVGNQDPEGARGALDTARELVPDIGRLSMHRLVEDLELELADHRAARNPPAGGDALSEAELRVLRLLPGELSYREIGQRLHVSLNTVRTHASRLRRKLGVSTRSEVISEAHRRGWL